MRYVAAVLCVVLLSAACGSSAKSSERSVNTAQRRVTASEQAVADANGTLEKAKSTFCTDAKAYVDAIDRYGKVFDQSAATVGDLKTAGADLVAPRESVTASVEAVGAAQTALANAQKELAADQAALASAQAAASGSSTSSTRPPPSTTTTTLVPAATIDRVKRAESDFAAAAQGVSDNTAIAEATTAFNSAAFALEIAWLRVLADAGCLTDEQHKQAEAALTEYTTALQTALQTAGYYSGKIDGVYGPATVDAVKRLQTAHKLPATGYVDRATATALSAALAAKGGAAATRALTHTAAVQSTLKLAGYWTGPIDGHWTPELTDALKSFQSHLGVPPTGEVDAATLAALETAIATATAPGGAASSSTTSTTG
jgi:murein L,D-transpeptidase YcbB/YkuD